MPNSPMQPEQKMLEAMSQMIGKLMEEIEQMLKAPVERAKDLGLTLNYDNLFAQNTNKAHRVSKYAQEIGKASEYTEQLFYSFV
ncbi:oxidoreductase [Peribacillus asahii]|uniref:Oxidoreductase n=1 Tax=Peribacillus asahii TaxID=228899 RepID=A0A3T0KRI6_9BACI|nr:oxidoreductase [Peribacillus asahii]